MTTKTKDSAPKGIYAEGEHLDKARQPLVKYGATSNQVGDVMNGILNLFSELPNHETRRRVLKTVATFFELET